MAPQQFEHQQHQQQKFHDAAVQHAHHQHQQPIRVGNYAVQQPRKSFQGASDNHLEELIQACQQPRMNENTHDVEDVGGRQMSQMRQERTLVPFFEGGDSTGVGNAALEWPVGNGHGNGSHGVNGMNGKQGARKTNGSSSNNNNKQLVNGTPKHAKGKKGQQQPGNQVKSPKHGGGLQHFQQNRPGHVHSQQRSSKFAGPAFTVSPGPDRLPMPSGKLL
jgi:hypothetical protein